MQRLRLVGEVGQVQRQPRLVATGQKARRSQLGHQWCCDHGSGLGHAVAIVGPGLCHQAQLAVEVRDIHTDFTLALLVERHRCALQRHDGDTGGRSLAALGQCRIAAERQAGQTALPGLNQLPVNIQLIRPIGLAPEQAGERVGGRVLSDIEHAHIHGSQQYMGLFGNAAIGIFSRELHRQRLLGTHFFRGIQRKSQLALAAIDGQVQHPYSTLGSDIGLALTGADHQCTDIQVMPGPARVESDFVGLALGRHFDFLPPQRAIAAFNQQVALASRRWCDRDLGRIAIGISGLVQRQLDLVGAHGTAFGVVLGTITGPETQAADQAGLRVFNLYAVRAPLHRKADLGGFARLEAEGLFVEVQKLLVVVIAPAVVVRVVPVVIAAFTHQAHLEVVGRQLVALAVSNQQLKLSRAVAIGFSAVKQAAQPRQTLCRPYRLHQAPGNRTPAGLLQTGLYDQLQR